MMETSHSTTVKAALALAVGHAVTDAIVHHCQVLFIQRCAVAIGRAVRLLHIRLWCGCRTRTKSKAHLSAQGCQECLVS